VELGQVLRITKKVAFGVAAGLVYYALYVVALPRFLGFILLRPTEIETREAADYFLFFVALGTAESVLSGHIVSVPLRVVSKLFGALVLFSALNGGVITVSPDAATVVELDASPILYAVLLFSLVYGALDALAYFERSERDKL